MRINPGRNAVDLIKAAVNRHPSIGIAIRDPVERSFQPRQFDKARPAGAVADGEDGRGQHHACGEKNPDERTFRRIGQ